MYTGAMEPFCLIGVYPLGWGAGWAVTGKMGGGAARRLLGVAGTFCEAQRYKKARQMAT